MTLAAICTEVGAPLVVDDVDVLEPAEGEVSVRLCASGVCHTDLSVATGILQAPLPIVLGHEGAGVIDAIGPGVTNAAVGDHVVITWVPPCRVCLYCRTNRPYLCGPGNRANQNGTQLDGTSRLQYRGRPVGQLGSAGTFSHRTVVSAGSVVPIDSDLPLDIAALLGCAVLTGTGAALNTATIDEGMTVAVIGCGGVGLAALQGARIAGAERIIAIDAAADKLDLASAAGATHCLVADGTELKAARTVADTIGADVVIEAVGIAPTIDLALRLTRPGGEVVLVGAPSPTLKLDVPALTGIIIPSRTIKGCWYGSSVPERDVPRMFGYLRSGELNLDLMISQHIALTDINDALEQMAGGGGARSMITF